MKRIIYIWLIFSIFLTSHVKADGVGLGLSAVYNLQTESFGAEFRLNLKPSSMFRVIPQVAYYPSFNKIHEYYAGLGFELNVFKIKKYNFYFLAHGGYNGWLNYETSLMKEAKYSNWVLEGGAGLVKNTGCVRPFLEYRYNGRWRETNLRLGLLFVFGCKKKGYGNNKRRKRSAMTCPAYN
jgi:hypothetical protein